ncbi:MULTISPECIES: Lrp/AsnC family transcriptional regulator [Hoeflea]|uniref:Lrp/AsnC family transcriptional regulator n=1 Tax=Hoeflea algicola TaxID=2983763 RepID=A0ABT3ZD08_9HYPH|nr:MULTISPECIES: Lrp/AsnC family transcriptional regulator [Hoeflea]MCY0149690.1 Lrp/AsnC family transcriptional regulator [Hoeflea algicola]
MAKPLDAIDRKILAALVTDGRISNNLLAEKVGLSPAPCWQRMRRLEKEGYIEAYSAILNQEKLGMAETALVDIGLNQHDDATVNGFGQAITAMPEVLEVYLTTGEYDYFIKVAVEGTRGYEKFLRRLYKVPGVRSTRSSFTLRCLKKVSSVSP